MFVALKDIVHAKGRFTLMIGVIALLTLLLLLLTGLTRGLAHQNISAIEALPADRTVLTPTPGADITWSDSQVDTDQAAIWNHTSAIETEPVSVGQIRIETDSAVTSLTVAGVDPDGEDAAGLPAVPTEDVVLLPRDIAADLEVASGDTVSVNGRDLTV